MPRRYAPPNHAGAGGLDLEMMFSGLVSRIAALEEGQHRGPGSSFGVPFRLSTRRADGTVITFAFNIDGGGNLTVTNLGTGAVSVIG